MTISPHTPTGTAQLDRNRIIAEFYLKVQILAYIQNNAMVDDIKSHQQV